MILVTGCAGFIGFHLTKILLQNGENVHGIDCVNDYYAVSLKEARLEILKKESHFTFQRGLVQDELDSEQEYKAIYHLASDVGARDSFDREKEYFENSLGALQFVLNYLKQNNKCPLFFSSSSSVYGDLTEYPFEEGCVGNTLNPYAKMKKECEELIERESRLNQINAQVFRFFTVYGPWGRPDMLPLKLMASIHESEEMPLFGNGEDQRDFTYVEDLVSLMLKFSPEEVKGFDICNLGLGNPVSVKKFIEVTEKLARKSANLSKQESHPGDLQKTFSNTSKLLKRVSNLQGTSLNSGIEQTLKWYRDYHK